jgi:outer membrane protein assembly factor BamB
MKYSGLKQIAFLIVLLLNQNLMADVGDPPQVTDGTRTFRSHTNYVEAVDSASGQVLWRTVLYKRWRPIIINPLVEEDVQWNIITSLKLDRSTLIAVNTKGSMYFLDTKTGKQIRNSIHKEQWTMTAVIIALFVVGLFYASWVLRRKTRRVSNNRHGNESGPAELTQ